VHHVNPTCGDEITLRVDIEDAVVRDISFDAMGCSISQASASVMYEQLVGKPLDEVWPILEEFVHLIEGRGKVEPDEDVLGDGIAFAGVAAYPARVKCALLGMDGFQGRDPASSGKGLHMSVTTEELTERMRDVVDPELGINVVDLGLVYGVHVDEDEIATIDMTLTSAACPLTDEIEDQTRVALSDVVKDFRINWVWMPPWGPDKITDEGREMLRALGFNV
jgi:SUF system NifU family Fe-S assembly protein